MASDVHIVQMAFICSHSSMAIICPELLQSFVKNKLEHNMFLKGNIIYDKGPYSNFPFW